MKTISGEELYCDECGQVSEKLIVFTSAFYGGTRNDTSYICEKCLIEALKEISKTPISYEDCK